MKSILILGSRGFIGKNLVEFIKNKKNIKLNYDRKKTDLTNYNNWKNFEKTEFLILLSSISNEIKFKKNIAKSYDNNLNIILNAIKFCLENNSKLIFISSASSKVIKSNYGISKLISELICKQFFKNFGLQYTILRIFNVYGPNQSKIYLIPSLIDKFKKNNKKIIVHNLDSLRDYIYIDDVCNAIYKSIFLKSKNLTLDIGTGKSYSVLFIINSISKILNKKVIINNLKTTKKTISKANLNKTFKYLKWKPKLSIIKGLNLIIK